VGDGHPAVDAAGRFVRVDDLAGVASQGEDLAVEKCGEHEVPDDDRRAQRIAGHGL
jgi:hypothetical protein